MKGSHDAVNTPQFSFLTLLSVAFSSRLQKNPTFEVSRHVLQTADASFPHGIHTQKKGAKGTKIDERGSGGGEENTKKEASWREERARFTAPVTSTETRPI